MTTPNPYWTTEEKTELKLHDAIATLVQKRKIRPVFPTKLWEDMEGINETPPSLFFVVCAPVLYDSSEPGRNGVFETYIKSEEDLEHLVRLVEEYPRCGCLLYVMLKTGKRPNKRTCEDMVLAGEWPVELDFNKLK